MRFLAPAVIALGVSMLAGQAAVGAPQALPRGSILFAGGPPGVEDFNAPRVYAVNARGGPLRELLVDADRAHWSPDGRLLAFHRSERDATGSAIHVMRADGTGSTVLVRADSPQAIGSDFDWSPDSRRLAFVSIEGETDVIYAIGVNGSRKVRLGIGRRPTWSPDGKRLAFTRDQSIYVVNDDGRKERRLTSGLSVTTDSPHAWSPDSRRLTFYSCCLKGFGIVDVQTRRVRTYLDGGVLLPSWSPDGKWIALAGDVGKRTGTFLVRPDGTRFRRISALGRNPYYPAWSPDSRWLAVENHEGTYCCDTDIWVMPVGGGRAARLTQGWRYGYGNYGSEWQPGSLPTSKLAGRSIDHSIPTDSVAGTMLVRTVRPIVRMSADGGAVAIGTARGLRGDTDVWQPALAFVMRFNRAGSRVTYAGARAVWASGPLSQMGGDDWYLGTATLSRPRVERVFPLWGRTRPMSDPVGDGALFAFSTWGPCRISQSPPCSFEPKRNGELFRLDGDRAVRIATSGGPLTALSVDSGRILVDRENGTLELLRSDGSSLRTFGYAAGSFLGAKLQGNDLVVLTAGTIEHYDTESGFRLHEWPLVAGSPRLEDVHGGIAVYVSGAYLYLVRLSDGRTVALESLGSSPLAQIEAPGLYYAYSVEDPLYPGRVSFIPFDELPVR